VFDVLWQAGERHEIANAGYRAIDRLRVEKGYVYWSTDVTPDTTPLEAGLEWRIAWDKGDFCGRDALVAQRRAGIDRRLCTFTLEPPAGHPVYPVSGEAIILGDDVVGFTTTANFGDTIGKPIAYGYVPVEHLDRTDWVIEVFGEAIPATRHEGALYDPEGAKLRG
jgi:sarcosine dehydrogenase